MSTRTEEGYAFWKENPDWVKAARVQAKCAIAQRRLKAELIRTLVPLVDWLTSALTRQPQPLNTPSARRNTQRPKETTALAASRDTPTHGQCGGT